MAENQLTNLLGAIALSSRSRMSRALKVIALKVKEQKLFWR